MTLSRRKNATAKLRAICGAANYLGKNVTRNSDNKYEAKNILQIFLVHCCLLGNITCLEIVLCSGKHGR